MSPAILDELNPRGIPIDHQDAPCPEPEGGCRPRLRAHCRGCRRDFVLCIATSAEISAMKRGGWHCGACRGGQP